MNCRDCRDLLNRHLDGEAIERPDVEAHVASCGDCRGLWGSAERVERGLRLLNPPHPPADFARRATAAALRDRATQRRQRTWLRVAVAAALLLMPWLGAHIAWQDPRP